MSDLRALAASLAASLAALRAATVAARERTGDATISTRTADGRVDVVRVTYNRAGTSIVKPVREGLTVDEAVKVLEGLR